mmetsp:Transcript_16735/g.21834  ORF Transcript_16735/g.21834 Transcript_16735/m.21834 type:complete len:231 (-) Transcript_16735:131-823(-)
MKLGWLYSFYLHFRQRVTNDSTTMMSLICKLLVLLLLPVFRCDAFLLMNPSHNRVKRNPNANVQHASSTTRLHGIKATIRIVGRKTSEKWIEEGCKMYETRLRPNNVDVVTEWCKNNDALIKNVQNDAERSTPIIMLDPFAKESSSEVFTDRFYKWVEKGGSRVVFVIGGAEGLPEELRSGKAIGNQKPILYSLSQLTFTHQFARLVLVEQIYRASEIVSCLCLVGNSLL